MIHACVAGVRSLERWCSELMGWCWMSEGTGDYHGTNDSLPSDSDGGDWWEFN